MIYLSKKPILALGASLALLAGCGSEVTETSRLLSKAGAIAKAKVLSKKKTTAPTAPAAAPEIPTKASVAKLGENMHFIAAPTQGILGFAPRVAVNGDWKTYKIPTNQTVTLLDGIVIGTRGFPGDLMGQSASIGPSQMFSGTFPKEYTKTQSILDLGSQIRKDEYTCEIKAPEDAELNVLGDKIKAIKYEEVCRTSFRAFQNRYWLNPSSRKIIQSQQSIHPTTGFIVVQEITK